jgi:hypothetical protein
MSDTRYEVKVNERTNMVRDRAAGRFLGAVGASFYDVWVFPLYTPSGRTVIREFPFDHPFHNGFFVGQHPVQAGERESNFWAHPPRRGWDDHIFVHVGRVDAPREPETEIIGDAVRFTYASVWRDENEEPLLDEVRTVTFRSTDDATVCDMTSTKTAAYGALEFPRTKFGSIGVRVEPRLLPPLGGVVFADEGRHGAAEVVHEGESDFVAYEAEGFGVLLHILDEGVRGPWFIRDYGMAMYNPTWTRSVSTSEGGSWTVGLRVVAYDGELSDERARAWLT